MRSCCCSQFSVLVFILISIIELAGCASNSHETWRGVSHLRMTIITTDGTPVREYTIPYISQGGSYPRTLKADDSGTVFIPITSQDRRFGRCNVIIMYGPGGEVKDIERDEVTIMLDSSRYLPGLVHTAGFSGTYGAEGAELCESDQKK